jgi:hypothetical protein
MAGPSTNTTQRLLRELKDYAKSPNEALLHLGPVDDEDLLRWEAVLKGVNGTPYEGMRRGSHYLLSHPTPAGFQLTSYNSHQAASGTSESQSHQIIPSHRRQFTSPRGYLTQTSPSRPARSVSPSSRRSTGVPSTRFRPRSPLSTSS